MLREVNSFGAGTSFLKQRTLCQAIAKESANHRTDNLKTFLCLVWASQLCPLNESKRIYRNNIKSSLGRPSFHSLLKPQAPTATIKTTSTTTAHTYLIWLHEKRTKYSLAIVKESADHMADNLETFFTPVWTSSVHQLSERKFKTNIKSCLVRPLCLQPLYVLCFYWYYFCNFYTSTIPAA